LLRVASWLLSSLFVRQSFRDFRKPLRK
jgi:hypothetical protein